MTPPPCLPLSPAPFLIWKPCVLAFVLSAVFYFFGARSGDERHHPDELDLLDLRDGPFGPDLPPAVLQFDHPVRHHHDGESEREENRAGRRHSALRTDGKTTTPGKITAPPAKIDGGN